ncbi:helix-turn-helix domain-containing protein [Nocardia abscessus]|uniref:helix-turn-helix domain-containing protein n=1 Tax=Nocardia abscessus TaxID=120957 RepID=UPI002458B4A0|nr:helix-turn-helix domain-containing protein [Nocardia abscessus]
MTEYVDAVGGAEAGQGRPRRVDIEPHPQLRSLLVQNYHGYPHTDVPPEHRSLPAGAAVQLVIKLADSAARPPEFLIGVRGHRIPIDGACAPSYIELSLDPLGAYTLLGAPGIELNGRVSDLSDVIGRRYRAAADRIREQQSWRDRFDLLDNFLLERAAAGRRPLPQVQRAWSLLNISAGAVPISRIAQEVGWSHKHLIAKFTNHVGLTPKVAARLIRFDRVRRRLLLDPQPQLHVLAAGYGYGYADQSHFNREFREFTGTTPTEFLEQNRLNAVQIANV